MAIPNHATSSGGKSNPPAEEPLTDKGRELHRLLLKEVANLSAGRLYKAAAEVKKRHPLVAEVLGDLAAKLDGAQPDWTVPALEEEVAKRAKLHSPGLLDGISELDVVRSFIPTLPERGSARLAHFATERDRLNRMLNQVDALNEEDAGDRAADLLRAVEGATVELYHGALMAIVGRHGAPTLIAEAALGQEGGV